ncbi:MAG: SMC-Scp complex subunit ScpB [Beijerinckiaceae bacterium]
MAAVKHARRSIDIELSDLPAEARWREWMGRVEAAIFTSPTPVPRETLSRLVGGACRLDDLIEDIRAELKGRPYDLVPVAQGWHHRTRPRFAEAVRGVLAGGDQTVQAELTPTESLVVTAIAYLQPATRAELTRLLAREVSRDVISRLRKLELIGAGPRAPTAGAPLTYVTTRRFLSVFGLETLRDLPDIEALEEAGLLERQPASPAEDVVDAELIWPDEDDVDL